MLLQQKMNAFEGYLLVNYQLWPAQFVTCLELKHLDLKIQFKIKIKNFYCHYKTIIKLMLRQISHMKQRQKLKALPSLEDNTVSTYLQINYLISKLHLKHITSY